MNRFRIMEWAHAFYLQDSPELEFPMQWVGFESEDHQQAALLGIYQDCPEHPHIADRILEGFQQIWKASPNPTEGGKFYVWDYDPESKIQLPIDDFIKMFTKDMIDGPFQILSIFADPVATKYEHSKVMDCFHACATFANGLFDAFNEGMLNVREKTSQSSANAFGYTGEGAPRVLVHTAFEDGTAQAIKPEHITQIPDQEKLSHHLEMNFPQGAYLPEQNVLLLQT